MSFPYEIDHDENPVVIRMHSFNYGDNRVGSTAVFVFPSASENYPSAFYTPHPSIPLTIETGYDYSYDGYLTSFYSPWDSDVPSDLEVYEIGFVPTLDGLPMPITRDNMPDTIEIKTNQNYSGGVIEIGMYVDGQFKLMAKTQLGLNGYWNESITLDVDNPFDLRPKMHMRIVGLDDTGEAGDVSVHNYLIDDEWSDQVNVTYRADFAFGEGKTIAYRGPEDFLTLLDAIQLKPYIQNGIIESPFTPYLSGQPAPIDPYDPPPFVYLAASYTRFNGIIQIGAYQNGNFVVMGQESVPEMWYDAIYEVELSPLSGSGAEQPTEVYFRIIEFDEDNLYGEFGLYLEHSADENIKTASYDPAFQEAEFNYALFEPETHYTNAVYLWTVDGISSGIARDFRFTLIDEFDGSKVELDPFDPPPFIDAVATNHTAGGKLQIGTYLDNGDFFVMGEQDLPSGGNGYPQSYKIPLIGIPPPAVPIFWTGFVRTTEYPLGIDS